MAMIQFVYGKDPYPDWFKQFSDRGAIQYSPDMETITITNPKSVVQAHKGDTLMYKDESIVVITKDVLERYSRR